LKKFIEKLCLHTHLKLERKHVIECKNKLKYSPIYECVACERLWFKSQTFCLAKTSVQHLTKYVPCLKATKFELLNELFV
jgi:hypothetical protein